MLRLELLDEKQTPGKALSAHDGRSFSALSNQVRLIARELGLRAAPDTKPPSLGDYLATKRIEIVEALDDPNLFGPFSGPSWATWKAVLKAAFALPMDADDLKLFRAAAERDPPKRRVRELWAIVGRRGGKDSIASAIAAFAAGFVDYRGILRPGEQASILALAVDKAQASIVHGVTVRPPELGVSYESFADPSGGLGDSFTCAIAHRDADGKAILDCLHETVAPFDPAQATAAIAKVLKAYGVTRVVGDKYAGSGCRASSAATIFPTRLTSATGARSTPTFFRC